LARRLKAHCRKQGILWIECGPGDLKYEIAREHRPKDPAFRGVFAVLVGRTPAPLWEVRRNGQGQITELRRTEQWPYVQHYYFQISAKSGGGRRTISRRNVSTGADWCRMVPATMKSNGGSALSSA
jgi:hypothetical protein